MAEKYDLGLFVLPWQNEFLKPLLVGLVHLNHPFLGSGRLLCGHPGSGLLSTTTEEADQHQRQEQCTGGLSHQDILSENKGRGTQWTRANAVEG